MMRWTGAKSLVLCILVLSSTCVVAQDDDAGSPAFTNKILGGFATPTVKPGQTAMFSFNLTNPYSNESKTMWNVSLSIGIYEYKTQETSRIVDENFKHAPSIEGMGPEILTQLDPIPQNDTVRMNLHITTSKDTPHGSYFSQSTYFVRFKLTFNFTDNATQVVLQSKGYFTAEQWDQMVNFTEDQSIVNLTYMRELGVTGLLPDSAFGLKVSIPRWPLGLLIAAIVIVAALTLYYFVLDNPGKYPRLEKRLYNLRGKLRELRSELKDRGRK